MNAWPPLLLYLVLLRAGNIFFPINGVQPSRWSQWWDLWTFSTVTSGKEIMLVFGERDLVFSPCLLFSCICRDSCVCVCARAHSKRLPIAYVDSSTSWFAPSFYVSIWEWGRSTCAYVSTTVHGASWGRAASSCFRRHLCVGHLACSLSTLVPVGCFLGSH